MNQITSILNSAQSLGSGIFSSASSFAFNEVFVFAIFIAFLSIFPGTRFLAALKASEVLHMMDSLIVRIFLGFLFAADFLRISGLMETAKTILRKN